VSASVLGGYAALSVAAKLTGAATVSSATEEAQA
jgi:hypothetical protein